MSWTNLFLAGLGGAGGSILRYLCQRAWNGSFPYGTAIVNITGCLAIGLFWGLLPKTEGPAKWLLMTGFCGGFTTFSAFTLESIRLLEEGKWVPWAAYAALNFFGGLAATFIGMKISS